jgi:hypothetical protein
VLSLQEALWKAKLKEAKEDHEIIEKRMAKQKMATASAHQVGLSHQIRF